MVYVLRYKIELTINRLRLISSSTVAKKEQEKYQNTICIDAGREKGRLSIVDNRGQQS